MRPLVCTEVSDWLTIRAKLDSKKSIGFVPTMGAWHEGHRSLLQRARHENDFVVASIFVNPTQFDNSADLENYPRVLSRDVGMAEDLADVVLAPSDTAIYADGFCYRVVETELSRQYEGAYRPGHFDGVLSVVLRLFNLAGATRAYFGEKDWQQLNLVRGMVSAFFLPVEIVACPTIRDENGLALSSRNARLSAAGKVKAASFYKVLSLAPSPAEAVSTLQAQGFGVDYVADLANRRVAAIHCEGVRLIDNVPL